MDRDNRPATFIEAGQLACGMYKQIRMRCALLGFWICLMPALLVMNSPMQALAFAGVVGAVGLPLGAFVLVSTLGSLTLKLIEAGYGRDVARREKQWARNAKAGDKFDLADILDQS